MRGSDKADGIHPFTRQERVNRLLAAVDQIQDTFRELCFLEQLEHTRHRAWDLLGRLDDVRVAAGDGIREKPERDHDGEIERRDARPDPQWLADHKRVDPR